MSKIIYEPASTRGDFGTLIITETEPVNIPFIFEIPTITMAGDKSTYNISESDYIIFTIKRHTRDISSVIEHRVDDIEKNCAVLELTQDDIDLLSTNTHFVLSATLYDGADNKIRVLVAELPIKIREVV